jgi:type II secretory pathway component PulC
MGRKKLEGKATVISTRITLRPGEDDDLITAFQRVPTRKYSAFIKSGLRSGGLTVNIDGLPDDADLAESLLSGIA